MAIGENSSSTTFNICLQ